MEPISDPSYGIPYSTMALSGAPKDTVEVRAFKDKGKASLES